MNSSMSRSMKPRKRLALARRQRGVTAVEFAMVFPLFFVIVYGIITFSLMMVAQQNLTLAAEEGARAALNYQPNTSLQSALANRAAAACVAAQAVVASIVKAATCTSTTGACSPSNGMQCVQVAMSYDYQSYPIVPLVTLLSITTMPKTLTSSATVQLNPENIQ